MYLLSHVDTPLKQFGCCIIFNLPQSTPLCNSSLFLCLFVHVFICFLLIWNIYTKYDVYTGWLLCADTSSMTIRYLSLQFIGTSCSSIAQSSSCLCVIGISHIISSWVYCWIMAHPSSCDKVDCYVYTKSIVSPISLWSYHWRIPTRKYFTYYMPYHRGSCCRSEGSWCVHINVFVWMGINFVTCMHIICQLAWAEWEDGQWSAPRRLYYIHIGRLWRWQRHSNRILWWYKYVGWE